MCILRNSAIALVLASILLPGPACAESATEAMTAFGLFGSWSVNCSKTITTCDQKGCGFRAIYELSPSGQPMNRSVTGSATPGQSRTVEFEINAATRVDDDKIKLTWTQRPSSVTTLWWMRQPGERWEAVFIKSGNKYRTLSAKREDGKKVSVEDGFLVQPPPDSKPDQLPTSWVRTTNETPWFEKCTADATVASGTGPIAAKKIIVGSVDVGLVLPTGFCELDPTQSSDAQFIARHTAQLARNGVQVLSLSAACSELPRWRAGVGLLDRFILLSADSRFISQPTPVDPEAMRKQVCDKIRAQAKQGLSAAIAMANSQLDAIARNVKMNSMAVVGVDDDDPNACYTAVLQKMQTQLGTEKLQLAIDTTVAIKGKIFFSTRYIPYVDMEGVAKSLEENRKFVASWRAANGM